MDMGVLVGGNLGGVGPNSGWAVAIAGLGVVLPVDEQVVRGPGRAVHVELQVRLGRAACANGLDRVGASGADLLRGEVPSSVGDQLARVPRECPLGDVTTAERVLKHVLPVDR